MYGSSECDCKKNNKNFNNFPFAFNKFIYKKHKKYVKESANRSMVLDNKLDWDTTSMNMMDKGGCENLLGNFYLFIYFSY